MADDPRADGYESFYREFDSPLMRRLRQEAYGEDIGQHSWVGSEELRADVRRLGLSSSSRLLDLGCGPCGPLTFVAAAAGCRATGLELSPSALRVGRERAALLGVHSLISTCEADLNLPLPLESAAFDAAMSLDVVLHVRDRSTLFLETRRVLCAGAKFLFTDAGVITGAVSNLEMQRRSPHGFTQFVIAGWNEALLEHAGFRLLEIEDRTASVSRNASGRLAAIDAHRSELEQASGAAAFASQREYLETVIELSRRRALSRIMYLAEVPALGND